MKNITLLIFFLLAGLQQGASQFTVRLVLDGVGNQLLVQIKNTDANIPTTAQSISSINMKLLGSGVAQIVSVSTNYTMLLPNGEGIITMSSTSLMSPENWIQNQYVTVATYGLNPGTYTSSSFSVQPDLDGVNDDVDDPIMSVQATGFFNIPLAIEMTMPLPVELMYFSAQIDGDDALLRWATATEHNNEGFEVQRSVNGNRFEKIGWVEGHGTSEMMHQYAFEDRDLLFGVYYYRLRQVDFDGDFEFSEVRSVNANKNIPAVVAYPNPTDGILYFSAPGEQNGLVVSLYNAEGQLLSRQTIHQNRLDLTKFPAGLYYVRIENGRQIDLVKIVKRK